MSATVFSSPCSENCKKRSREELIAIAINEAQGDLDATDLLDLRRQLEAAPIAEVESFCRDVLGLSIEREPGEWSLADAFFTTGEPTDCRAADETGCDGCDRDGSDHATAQEIGQVVIDLAGYRREIAQLMADRKAIDERLKVARAKAAAAREARDLLLRHAFHDGF